jgi:hypothetical protein
MAFPGEILPASLDTMPPEIMDIIAKSQTKGAHGKDEFVLDAQDFGNLRLVNRQVCHTTFHTFAKRFFTLRKHMLSRFGLQALDNISRHPHLRKYVKEVAFGPERVRDDVADHMRDCDFIDRMSEVARKRWERHYGGVYELVVSEQQKLEWEYAFLGTSGLSSMLSAALSGFSALENVRIDAHKDESDKEQPWDRPWGITNTLRALGYAELVHPVIWKQHPPTLPEVDRHSRCWHHRVVLGALHRTKELPKNCTIGLSIFTVPVENYSALASSDPFDLKSSERKALKSRVRSITYDSTTYPSMGTEIRHGL